MPLVAVGLFLLGAGVGAIGTLIGAGGGFLFVPIIGLLDPALPTATLTAISLGMVVFSAASGTVAYVRQGRVDFTSAIPLAIATIPGSVAGALLTRSINRGVFDLVFAVLLIGLAALIALRKPPPTVVNPAAPGWGVVDRVLVDNAGKEYRYRVNMPLGIAVALVEGAIAGVFGVGGGILMVPVLVGFLRFPPHVATATSTSMVLITASAATLTHLGGDELNGYHGLVLLLGAGAVVGAQVGARLSRLVGGIVLVRVLSIALGFVGLRLALQALFRA